MIELKHSLLFAALSLTIDIGALTLVPQIDAVFDCGRYEYTLLTAGRLTWLGICFCCGDIVGLVDLLSRLLTAGRNTFFGCSSFFRSTCGIFSIEQPLQRFGNYLNLGRDFAGMRQYVDDSFEFLQVRLLEKVKRARPHFSVRIGTECHVTIFYPI